MIWLLVPPDTVKGYLLIRQAKRFGIYQGYFMLHSDIKLYSCSTRNAFPLPRIEDALEALGQARYFSTLDLTSGYWQVEVAEQDKHKTAFSTPMGLYEANRMPFGLQNAHSTFQRLKTFCFGDLDFKSPLIYLDDIIILKDF